MCRLPNVYLYGILIYVMQTTLKKFKEIKNKRVVAISFNPQTNKRVLSYGGLSYITALEHQIEQTKKGLICIIADMILMDKVTLFEEEHLDSERIDIVNVLGLIALEEKNILNTGVCAQ